MDGMDLNRMDLTSVKTVKNLLKSRQIRPSRGLGQNFLVDRGAVGKVIDAAELKPDDTVLEIGPGLGTLTKELAKRVKRVIAVEKDRKMVEILKETLKDFDNVGIIHDDIRNLLRSNLLILRKFVEVRPLDFKAIGNLPFYLTAPVIRQFLENTGVQPRQMVLVAQKEVGQRICAKPPDMNLLAVSVQFYSEPKIVSYIPKESFWPQPKVDSAILKIIPRQSAYSISVNPLLFFKIVKAGFSQPRKQLINNLSRGLKCDKIKVTEWLLKNNIKPAQRAETLSVESWISLTKTFVLQ